VYFHLYDTHSAGVDEEELHLLQQKIAPASLFGQVKVYWHYGMDKELGVASQICTELGVEDGSVCAIPCMQEVGS
jgi:hypothetical protein